MAKSKILPAPWESAPKPQMLLCHFNVEELKSLDTLQGGANIDPSTGIREYSALREVLKNPEVRKIFSTVTDKVEKTIKHHGKLTGQMRKEYESSKKQLLTYHETPEEDLSPDVRRLEKLGTEGDTKLAWIPYELAELLVEIRGNPKVNPHTGLLMFGFFKSLGKIARAVLPVVAAVVTGGASLPVQIAATAGAGALGSALGGGRGSDIWKSALISGGTAGLSPGIQGVTGWNPSIAHGLARTGAGMLGGENFQQAAMQGLTSGGLHYGMGQLGQAGYLPSWMSGGAGAGSGANAAGRTISAAEAIANPSAAAQTMANQSLNMSSPGIMDKLGLGNLGMNASTLIPLAGLGAAAYMGYKGDKKKYQHDLKEHEEQRRREEDRARREGYYTPWIEPPIGRARNPKFYEPNSYGESPFFPTAGALYNKGGHVAQPPRVVHNPIANHPLHHQPKLQSVTEGVLIKGPGKGQQDKIKTTVPENSYIIDASSTSMFGDGSSDAGANIMKEFENQVRERFAKQKGAHRVHGLAQQLTTRTKQLPVYLSDSEYKFDPLTVTMLGDGDNTRGAKMLKAMVKKLRAHKSIKGGGLPPKAGSPWDYLPNSGRAA